MILITFAVPEGWNPILEGTGTFQQNIVKTKVYFTERLQDNFCSEFIYVPLKINDLAKAV